MELFFKSSSNTLRMSRSVEHRNHAHLCLQAQKAGDDVPESFLNSHTTKSTKAKPASYDGRSFKDMEIYFDSADSLPTNACRLGQIVKHACLAEILKSNALL